MTMQTLEADSTPPVGRFAIVAAKFNREVVDLLVEGAIEGFRKQGVSDSAFDLVRVPGAFELPLVCRRLAASGKYLAIVALGAVIRGDTDHYDYVCDAACRGILDANLTTGVPVIFGVLTCDNDEQAMARAGGAHGNKGFDAALAALEMVNLLKKLP
jgi:6,7-dimethyl-8-ribityllumazine synthase